MMHLKKPKTALRDGFQSVIDYWPESHEATVAAYCIADAYRTHGRGQGGPGRLPFPHQGIPGSRHRGPLARRPAPLRPAPPGRGGTPRPAQRSHLSGQTHRGLESQPASTPAANSPSSTSSPSGSTRERRPSPPPTPARSSSTPFTACPPRPSATCSRNPPPGPPPSSSADQLLATLRAETIERPELDEGPPLPRRRPQRHPRPPRPTRGSIYEEIGERFGRDDDLLGRMAEWCKQRDKRDEARRIYGEFKDVVAGRKNIAAMFLEEGKVAEAIEVFRKLIEIDGDHAGDYLWSIAGCYEKLSDWKKAIATYRQIDRFPDNYFRDGRLPPQARRTEGSHRPLQPDARSSTRPRPRPPCRSASPTRRPRTRRRPSAPSSSPASATRSPAKPAAPTPTSRTNTTSTSPSAAPRRSRPAGRRQHRDRGSLVRRTVLTAPLAIQARIAKTAVRAASAGRRLLRARANTHT